MTAAERERSGADRAIAAASPIRPFARTLAPTLSVSPVVARLAAEHSLDLSKISGSGQDGRVTKQDVLKYVESHKNQPSRMPAGARSSDDSSQCACGDIFRPIG